MDKEGLEVLTLKLTRGQKKQLCNGRIGKIYDAKNK